MEEIINKSEMKKIKKKKNYDNNEKQSEEENLMK